MKKLNKFKWVILFLILTSIVYFINSENGKNILNIAKDNFISMLLIIPPIYILIGSSLQNSNGLFLLLNFNIYF